MPLYQLYYQEEGVIASSHHLKPELLLHKENREESTWNTEDPLGNGPVFLSSMTIINGQVLWLWPMVPYDEGFHPWEMLVRFKPHQQANRQPRLAVVLLVGEGNMECDAGEGKWWESMIILPAAVWIILFQFTSLSNCHSGDNIGILSAWMNPFLDFSHDPSAQPM